MVAISSAKMATAPLRWAADLIVGDAFVRRVEDTLGRRVEDTLDWRVEDTRFLGDPLAGSE